MDQETKICCSCKVEKGLDEFSNYRAAKDGKQPKCKICCFEYQQERARKTAPIREQKRLEKSELKRAEIAARLASGYKQCSSCHETKETSSFNRDNANLDGYRPNCKSCVAEYNALHIDERREYQQRNKHKWKEYQERYQTKNADKIAQRMEETAEERKAYYREYNKTSETRKVYYENNKDKQSERARQYRAKNVVKFKEYNKNYATNNKHIINAKTLKRYASKLKALPAWADLEKIKEVYKLCSYLTEQTGIRHNVDHIVPLQSKLVCGLHCESNLQILTKTENLSKSNRFWPDMP